ncbi:MAG: GspB domain-containing protein, partial [Burkholderiales bacterium]|nr:GspB domain-containing protein [Burkholderiales bacterium]
NDRQYRRGERIQGRVRLEAIMAEGVVLSHDGIRFKLPRPN